MLELFSDRLLEDKSRLVRSTAAEKISNQNVLAKMAIEDKEAYVRLTAIKKIINKELLVKIAQESRNKIDQKTAADLLFQHHGDKELIEYYLNYGNYVLQEAAKRWVQRSGIYTIETRTVVPH